MDKKSCFFVKKSLWPTVEPFYLRLSGKQCQTPRSKIICIILEREWTAENQLRTQVNKLVTDVKIAWQHGGDTEKQRPVNFYGISWFTKYEVIIRKRGRANKQPQWSTWIRVYNLATGKWTTQRLKGKDAFPPFTPYLLPQMKISSIWAERITRESEVWIGKGEKLSKVQRPWRLSSLLDMSTIFDCHLKSSIIFVLNVDVGSTRGLKHVKFINKIINI